MKPASADPIPRGGRPEPARKIRSESIYLGAAGNFRNKCRSELSNGYSRMLVTRLTSRPAPIAHQGSNDDRQEKDAGGPGPARRVDDSRGRVHARGLPG